MNKFFSVLVGIILLMLVCCSLGIALIASMASLISATANFVSSTTLLTTQCISGLFVISALVCGAMFGWGWAVARGKVPSGEKASFWVSPTHLSQAHLSEQQQPSFPNISNVQSSTLTTRNEILDDCSLQGWGF